MKMSRAWIGVLTSELLVILVLVGLLMSGVLSIHREMTDSMYPTLQQGNLVVFAPVPASSLHAGDVIAFADPLEPRITIMHEVAHTSGVHDGQVSIITQGQANPSDDPWTLRYRAITQVSREILVIPSMLALAILCLPILIGLALGIVGVTRHQGSEEAVRCADATV